MKACVLDAGVAIKWSVPAAGENLVAEAFRALDRYTAQELDFIVPDIFWAEIGNILWKGVRQRRWSSDSAEIAAIEMRNRRFTAFPSEDLLVKALTLLWPTTARSTILSMSRLRCAPPLTSLLRMNAWPMCSQHTVP